ncbi:MAG: ABC transporter ATP-binding protein [Pseudoclavibacter sp.]
MIEFTNVSKRYRDGTLAVDDFSYVVPSHRIVALVGSSGSGKTTLLRMVNKMVSPTSGSVSIDGEAVDKLPAVQLRRSIGYVLQAGGLLPHLTVRDNVATVPVLEGTSKASARMQAMELLERVGLDASVAGRYPSQLSGGQQQRVGVARALAADPNILLMDEPFGAVDPIVRRELQDELLRLQRDLGKTIILVTHDADEALRVADEVVVLRVHGAIAQAGTPQEIVTAPADDFVRTFLGGDRELRLAQREGRRVALDSAGRVAGVIVS